MSFYRFWFWLFFYLCSELEGRKLKVIYALPRSNDYSKSENRKNEPSDAPTEKRERNKFDGERKKFDRERGKFDRELNKFERDPMKQQNHFQDRTKQRCYQCGRTGHLMRNCFDLRQDASFRGR